MKDTQVYNSYYKRWCYMGKGKKKKKKHTWKTAKMGLQTDTFLHSAIFLSRNYTESICNLCWASFNLKWLNVFNISCFAPILKSANIYCHFETVHQSYNLYTQILWLLWLQLSFSPIKMRWSLLNLSPPSSISCISSRKIALIYF